MKATKNMTVIGWREDTGAVSEDVVLARLNEIEAAANMPFGGRSSLKTTKRTLPHTILTDDMDDAAFNNTVMSAFASMRNVMDGKEASSACKTGSIFEDDFSEDNEILRNATRESLQIINDLEQNGTEGMDDAWETSPEFISAWIEKNLKLIRFIVRPFAKSLADTILSMDDLMQEAFLSIYLAFDSYDPNDERHAKPTTFFVSIILNRMRELYRFHHAAKRSGTCCSIDLFDFEGRDDDEMDIAGDQYEKVIASSLTTVEDAVIYSESIASALNSVQGRMKSILELTAIGYTQTEIGAYLGRSQGLISGELKKIRKEIM